MEKDSFAKCCIAIIIGLYDQTLRVNAGAGSSSAWVSFKPRFPLSLSLCFLLEGRIFRVIARCNYPADKVAIITPVFLDTVAVYAIRVTDGFMAWLNGFNPSEEES